MQIQTKLSSCVFRNIITRIRMTNDSHCGIVVQHAFQATRCIVGSIGNNRFGPSDDPLAALADPQMMGKAPANTAGIDVGENRRLAGGEQPVDRAARGLSAIGVKLAEQLHQADPAPLIVA